MNCEIGMKMIDCAVLGLSQVTLLTV